MVAFFRNIANATKTMITAHRQPALSRLLVGLFLLIAAGMAAAGAAEIIPDTEAPGQAEVPIADAVQTDDGTAKPLVLLGVEVAAGTAQRLSWTATELFEGVPVATPVLVVNGRQPGPTL